MDHEIRLVLQNEISTSVMFKNVPLSVPDEEIIHLCMHYGIPVNNTVTRDTLQNDQGRGMKGSSKFVDMILDKGKTFENFYWMEGPLPGAKGRRITVLHPGQIPWSLHEKSRLWMPCCWKWAKL